MFGKPDQENQLLIDFHESAYEDTRAIFDNMVAGFFSEGHIIDSAKLPQDLAKFLTACTYKLYNAIGPRLDEIPELLNKVPYSLGQNLRELSFSEGSFYNYVSLHDIQLKIPELTNGRAICWGNYEVRCEIKASIVFDYEGEQIGKTITIELIPTDQRNKKILH